jgi:hypothetical protein
VIQCPSVDLSFLSALWLERQMVKSDMPVAFVDPAANGAFDVVAELPVKMSHLSAVAVDIHTNPGSLPLNPSERPVARNAQ